MNLVISCHASPAAIVLDPWQIVRDSSGLLTEQGPLLLPLELWRQQRKLSPRGGAQPRAVWLVPEDEFQADITVLLALPLIAVDFTDAWDGREYAMASLLRRRYGYKGELRAIGDVQRDQLLHMQRCGFDSFHLQEEQQMMPALKELGACSTQLSVAAGERVARLHA